MANQKRISKRSVEAARLGTSIWDTEVKGFGVRVSDRGRRTYIFKYRVRGQQRKRKIGLHGAINAEQARRIALRWASELADGNDPHPPGAVNDGLTVQDVIKEFRAVHLPTKKEHSRRRDQRILERHIAPIWGDRVLGEIQRLEVIKWHRAFVRPKIDRRGRSMLDGKGKPVEWGHYEGDHALVLLRLLFNKADAWGLFTGANPARHISLHRPASKSIRHYKWTAEERKALLCELDALTEMHRNPVLRDKRGVAHDHRPTFRKTKTGKAGRYRGGQLPAPVSLLALRFHYWSPCRPAEILGLRWDINIKLEEGMIVWPEHKTDSSGEVMTLPISQPIRNILTELGDKHRISGCPWVFPNAAATGPLTTLKNCWETIRGRLGLLQNGRPPRLHDFRHAYGDALADAGYSRPLIKLAMNHKTDQASIRYARGSDQKKADIINDMARRMTEAISVGRS